ncbi:TRAP transporter small permease [Pelomonas sp. SE-A7]|uniref:TRAP transporter small permease n=1 Tax=Pelomonas sp. SE-A7 TaxID=3054953 RepID=UPI00259C7BB1|nr:TRAP transporter small permease [Pelomonas sp. SE-A7]MDM4767828.1 TRAP transporter small permease [Pelomonas sp. SE-A7]
MLAAFHRSCALLSRLALQIAAVALIAVVLCVQVQVVGRYLLNDTPTWTEALALLLVLYITGLAVAVGVREASHLGLESLLVLLPERPRRWAERLIHLLVGLFGALMAWSGWEWTLLKWDEAKPMLGVPEGLDYLPLLISGLLVLLFSIEQLIASVQGLELEPAWP